LARRCADSSFPTSQSVGPTIRRDISRRRFPQTTHARFAPPGGDVADGRRGSHMLGAYCSQRRHEQSERRATIRGDQAPARVCAVRAIRGGARG
jgi:hypothetical protein